jgi:hypothetical protein
MSLDEEVEVDLSGADSDGYSRICDRLAGKFTSAQLHLSAGAGNHGLVVRCDEGLTLGCLA